MDINKCLLTCWYLLGQQEKLPANFYSYQNSVSAGRWGMDCKQPLFEVGASDPWSSPESSYCRGEGMGHRASFPLFKVVSSFSGHTTNCVDKGMFLFLCDTAQKPPFCLASTAVSFPLLSPGCHHHGPRL